MARPKSKGLEYFPVDVDMWEDDKLSYIAAKHGAVGEKVINRLLASLYRVGYCYQWNEKVLITFSARIGEDRFKVAEIVSEAVDSGFFDESMLKEHQILTSKGIQRRYNEATKKRADAEISPHHSLLSSFGSENHRSGVVSAAETTADDGVSDEKSAQSKVKESKVNKSKGNESKEKDRKSLLPRINYKTIDDFLVIGEARLPSIAFDQFLAGRSEWTILRAIELVDAWVQRAHSNSTERARRAQEASNCTGTLTAWALRVAAKEEADSLAETAKPSRAPLSKSDQIQKAYEANIAAAEELEAEEARQRGEP